MIEPEPQLKLDGVEVPCKVTGIGDAVAAGNGKVVDVVTAAKSDPAKPVPDTKALTAAYAIDAVAKGGTLEPEQALRIMRSAGLVAPEPAEPKEPPFKWAADENEDVILPQQLSTAVYCNADGAAVIRQENLDFNGPNDGNDFFVVVQHKNLPELIAALQKIAKAPCDAIKPTKART